MAVEQPIRLSGQQGTAFRLCHHGAGTLPVQLALQAQIGGIIVVIVQGKLRPGLSRDGHLAAVLYPVQITDKKHGVNISRPLSLRSG